MYAQRLDKLCAMEVREARNGDEIRRGLALIAPADLQARVVRISNSLHIGHIMLSEAYYQDVLAGKWPGLIARSAPEELSFDPSGALTTPIEA